MGFWNPAGSGQTVLRLEEVQSFWPHRIRLIEGSRASYQPALPKGTCGLKVQPPARTLNPYQFNQSVTPPVFPFAVVITAVYWEQGHWLEAFAWACTVFPNHGPSFPLRS